MRSPRSFLVVLAVAFVVLAALRVSAVLAAEPPVDRRSELLYLAQDELQAERYKEAIQAWRAAWDLKPSYEIACNIGRISLLHGSARDAAEFLARCTRLTPEATTPIARQRHEEELQDLEDARRKVTALRIVASQPGAVITIDGREIGIAPLSEDVFVEPGEHRITAQLEGFKPVTETIQTTSGETRILTLPLEKVGARPPVLPRTSSGPRARARSPWPTIGGSAAAAIGIGLGTGFSVAADSEHATERAGIPDIRSSMVGNCASGSTSTSCAEYTRAGQTGETYRAVAAASFIGAGLAAVTTAVYLLYPHAPAPPTASKNGITVAQW